MSLLAFRKSERHSLRAPCPCGFCIATFLKPWTIRYQSRQKPSEAEIAALFQHARAWVNA
jgi:hypothetical protein